MMNRIVIALVLAGTLLVACNDFSKLQKSADLGKKYDGAVMYYKKGDYTKAQMLFDELYSVMRTTNKADSISYYLAYCNYELGDYIMASYLFRSYFRSFPTSPRAAECLYMSAYCHYLISPPYSLDQGDTYAAIEEFQYFIQMFPNDTARIRECNKLVDAMHRKLEKKAYMNAKMYYELQDYKAAITSFDQFLHDFPDTKYREEVLYLSIDSKYSLAFNSIDTKKEERIADAIKTCNLFLATYRESEYTDEVKDILDKCGKLQEKINNDRKTSNNVH